MGARRASMESTDAKQRPEHAPGIDQQIDGAPERRVVVGDARRDFDDAQTLQPRQVEKLRVECEAVDARSTEEAPRRVGPEALEPCLRIGVRQSQHGPDGKVEERTAAAPSPPWSRRAGRRQLAAADRHIRGAIGERRHEQVDLVERIGEIAIGEADDVRARGEHRFAHGGALASIERRAIEANGDPGNRGDLLRDRVRRSIARSIVDEAGAGVGPRRQPGGHRRHHMRYLGDLLEDWKDQLDLRHGGIDDTTLRPAPSTAMTRPAANPHIAIDILRNDPCFLVIDKPAGAVVEPGIGHARDALLNGLMSIEGARLAALGERRDWGLLHRLDRETSGCVLVALDAQAYDHLRAQFEARTIRKHYLAAVAPPPAKERGRIDLPLSETRRDQLKISVPGRRGAGKPAITEWRVLRVRRGQALLEVAIATGRLHQIRAHMALLGSPVVGDPIYRADLPPRTSRPPRGRVLPPLLLHGWRLAFDHPRGTGKVEVESPPPAALDASKW